MARPNSDFCGSQLLVNRELDAERRTHLDLTSGMVDLVGELKRTTLDMNQMVRTQNMVGYYVCMMCLIVELIDAGYFCSFP
jgi:predicted translin family RNA/ssDNA-binding protein